MTTTQEQHEQNNIFIARQPIFQTNSKVYGYELLFRSSLANFFDPDHDGAQATSKVITNSFLLIGINNITGGKKAFINFDGELLTKEYPTLFPKRVTVVEVLESVKITPEVVKGCQNLKRKGYTIALDDFDYNPAYEQLLPLADIIKFDIRALSPEELARQVEKVSCHKLRLLAEKVETTAEFEMTKALGFHYFQGYFFAKPNIISGKDVPGSKLTYLQILKQVQDENYDFHKLSSLISNDVSLSYKLLKYVNSAYFGISREIRSLHSAVAMLGEVDLRRWLSLMMLSYMASDKPAELISCSLLRAKFCELIGQQRAQYQTEIQSYFTVGMFSLIHAILDQPMEDILRDLSLAENIKDALLGKGKNYLLATLNMAKAYETGRWDQVANYAKLLNVDEKYLPTLFDEALEMLHEFDFG